VTQDTSELAHKLRGVTPRARLCRMLRSILRSWPQAKLLHGKGGFGAQLGDGISVWIRYSGRLAPADMRDLLVLFAIWLVADPQRLIDEEDENSGGASWMDSELRYLSSGRLG